MKKYDGKLQQITSFIEGKMKVEGVGLSVAIVKNKERIFSKGFGTSRIGNDLFYIDGETRMSIQSISKNFAALSIMKLVDKQLVSLDDPVVNHLPYFRTQVKHQSDSITIRHVLSHTAGFPSDLGIANMIAPNVSEIFSDTPTEFQEALDYYHLTEEEIRSVKSREDVTKWFEKVELQYEAGKGWAYCTDAYVIIADIVEKVSGRGWDTFLSEEILEPLSLKRTTSDPTVVLNDDNSAKYYLGEGKEETPFPMNPVSAPIGYLYSTANDLSDYLMFHMEGKSTVLPSVFTQEMQKIVRPVSEEWQFDSNDRSYGLAWFIDTYRGFRRVEHGGGQMAVRSLMTMIPELELGVVVLMNFDGTMHHEICDKILDVFIGE
ncbi:beta-lactamase family protein [Rossellomorea aquimaris]|uniref:serine hydrolase domain-containing protein n=1 Tax=Rossellomorea aquimaris TaxID=189382 RepID=UPI001CD24416|nr:serine hydrolase domain-containing protein [Rossellomorea aquimaris]MCA1053993.1 beta-lactamase family protein [Rossellomorea aquimaris]